jgi:nucleotide-binding universal stress UspA family protein
VTAPFKSILCGVDGSSSSTEAARQAIALAAPATALHFIAVYTSFELGPDYAKATLQEALDEASRLAREAGIPATTEMREARYAIDVLIPESEKHDLLVIGIHGKSRAAGILLGSTASEAAHGTRGPLLIAREPSGGEEFPRNILLASDGSDGSRAPAEAAAALAAAFDGTLDIVQVDDGKHPEGKSVVDTQVTEISEATGQRPALLRPGGHPTEQIVEAAKQRGTSLIICGRRGLSGIKALGSVSERVAHQAECSVLLVPAD